MTVCYLDLDDEITDAVSRLRGADDRRFILVLPSGSRLATSRINFRLLAREGQERAVTVALVSPESGVRSLAISAGLPAYGSVEEAESALPADGVTLTEPSATPRTPITGTGFISGPPGGRGPAPEMVAATPAEPMAEQARRSASGPASPLAAALPSGPRSGDGVAATPASVGADLEGTRVLPRSGASGFDPRHGGAAAGAGAAPWETQPWPAPTRRGRRLPRIGRWLGMLVRLALVVALVGGLLLAAYLYLPNVSITITPATQPVGPMTVRITADPLIAVPDPAAGAVPAERVDIPLTVSETFPATGADVEETRASGRVRFQSENTLFEVPIAEGTRVGTESGVEFETTRAATLDTASFRSGPSSVEVPVRAVRPGPAGNVEPGAVTRLPEGLEAQLVSVTNPEAMSGGTRTEIRVVTQEDYDGAVDQLRIALAGQLDAALDDPATIPRGLVAFPETVSQESMRTEPPAGDLVGLPAESFTLTAEDRGGILAVDEVLVAELASERLEEDVPPSVRLFPDSISADIGTGAVAGDTIVYEVSVSAEQYVPLQQSDLVAAVRGRSIDDARVILSAHGDVEITPWPEFIGTVPDDPRRINLTILEPQRRSP